MTGSIALWLNSIPQRLSAKSARNKRSTEKTFTRDPLSDIAFDISVAGNISSALTHALTTAQHGVSHYLNCDLYLVQFASNAIGFELHHSPIITPPPGLLNQLSYQLAAQAQLQAGTQNDNHHLRYKLPGLEHSVHIQRFNGDNQSLSPTFWLILCSTETLPSLTGINKEMTPLANAFKKGINGWHQQQARIQQAVRSERATHAAELHDSMAQILGYIRIKSSRLASLCHDQAHPSIRDMSDDLALQANCAYRQARELISTSRLSLDGNSLIDSIHNAVDEFEQRSGIVFELDNRVGQKVSTKDDIQALYIVREALCNIVRHSQATHARVMLLRQANDSLKIRIEDNGIGFKENNSRQDSFGLKIMQERAAKLAASLYIIPRKNGGTRVDLHIPGANP